MILKTNDFQNVVKTIELAVDNNKANLELITKDNVLKLWVTNGEYFVAVNFELADAEEFHATVSAQLFLNLVSGFTSDTFELKIKDNTVVIKSGKSSYKLPMIYENDKLMTLQPIIIENKTVEMNVSKDILYSILNINSKELLKIKNIKTVDLSELQKLYYITNEGCFTFTTGACLNKFTLEKPIKVLLNDRIVKLFKLFKTDVNLSFGFDALANGTTQTKICFETDDIYLAAIITNDAVLLSKVNGPCEATKAYINETYSNHLVLSAADLGAAISRLMLFTKNSSTSANMLKIMTTVSFTGNELTISDDFGNSESVVIENGSYVDSNYSMRINIVDIKLVLDSCKDEHITLNCGNNKSVIISRGNVSNLIPEIIQ